MPLTARERFKRLLKGLPEKVKIGKQYVGEGQPVFIIAEVGINHNGDVELAKQLIDAAADAGADAVKFQKRTTTELLTKEGLERPYDSPNAFAATYGEHREKLEFQDTEYRELKDYAHEKGILFFASIWDHGSTDFMDQFDIDAYKVPSADVINTPLLEYVAQKNKPVLLSTGMSTEEEIEEAVNAVLKHNDRLVLFQCLSLYPQQDEMTNLRYMDVLKKKFAPLPVGYSGHEIEMMPTLAAVARGAHIIERHLTLDKSLKGSDHAASLEPAQFKDLVDKIRHIEKILGEPKKIMYEELKPLREKLAKSIATRVAIPKGAIITHDMLTAKSPGRAIKPSKMYELEGVIAQETLEADTIVPLAALDWPRK